MRAAADPDCVEIAAPLSGWLRALESVPDPVFADRMLGDGVAIDPLDGVLRAPCAAVVIGIAAASHAVTLELANGAQLLLHIGLDTVKMGGAGFTQAKIAVGQRVREGDALLHCDLDRVAARAKSLVTPIIVANAGYRVTPGRLGRRVAAGEPVMTIQRLAETAAVPQVPVDGAAITRTVAVGLGSGLHARPAARIAAALAPLEAEVQLSCHGRSADARSVVAMFTLGAACRDTVALHARGRDAAAALAAVAAILMETEDAPPPAPRNAQARAIGAAPGLAIGPVFQLRLRPIAVPEQRDRPADDERAALAAARETLADEIAGQTGHAIARTHQALLRDPELIGRAEAAIARGASAGQSWREATAAIAQQIRATGNAVLMERIADLHDIEHRLLAALHGGTDEAIAPPPGAILVADDVPPSLLLGPALAAVAGIVTARGGPSSHAAILAAAAGVPMVVAAGPHVCDVPDGTLAIVDGSAGTFDLAPSPERLAGARATAAAQRAQTRSDAEDAAAPCLLADGVRIQIFANLAAAADAPRAVAAGAEGCGLLRTEFLFADRAVAPDEAEQAAVYRAIAAALHPRPLIVRTLDAGADKPLPYLRQPPEDNPALGRRGIRLGLAEPALLATQFRAILTGVPAGQCHIMLPMVIDRDELRAARALLDAARAALGWDETVPLGVMIETPAAALLADSLAAEADFLSIGTNDLTQYALAVDRGNAAVAGLADALHPAVLRLIATACAGARAHRRWVGVCGGLAADPVAAPVLVGLGVTKLSVPPAAIPALKARLRRHALADCEELAAAALACATASEVRALLAGTRA